MEDPTASNHSQAVTILPTPAPPPAAEASPPPPAAVPVAQIVAVAPFVALASPAPPTNGTHTAAAPAVAPMSEGPKKKKPKIVDNWVEDDLKPLKECASGAMFKIKFVLQRNSDGSNPIVDAFANLSFN